MKKLLKISISLLIIISLNIYLMPATFAIDSAYQDFNNDMYELYGIYNHKKPFNINDTATYGYQSTKEIGNTTYYLSLPILKQGLGDKITLNCCLDGSYFVYHNESGVTRNRPKTLTYNPSKKGVLENQYLGYNLEGVKYDNPALPWNSWSSSKPLKNWTFKYHPWLNPTIRTKYNIDAGGGTFSKTNMESMNVDLTKSIELGIYAKYIKFSARETVKDGGVSNADLDKSIYYGYKVGTKELSKATGFSKPSTFETGTTWQDYVYILTPPTNTTWGSGFMFYDNKDAINGVDYVTIPLAPFDIPPPVITSLKSDNITGCFLSEPKKVYNNTKKTYEMKTWVIRATNGPITNQGSIPIQIWLKQGVNDDNQFVDDKMGTKIFDQEVMFTPEHPYWVKEITYPLPAKGTMSGIFVSNDGDHAAYNYVWRTDFDTLAYGSHSTSKEKWFDALPWDKIKAEYGITREN